MHLCWDVFRVGSTDCFVLQSRWPLYLAKRHNRDVRTRVDVLPEPAAQSQPPSDQVRLFVTCLVWMFQEQRLVCGTQLQDASGPRGPLESLRTCAHS